MMMPFFPVAAAADYGNPILTWTKMWTMRWITLFDVAAGCNELSCCRSWNWRRLAGLPQETLRRQNKTISPCRVLDQTSQLMQCRMSLSIQTMKMMSTTRTETSRLYSKFSWGVMNVDISLHLYADVETVNMILYVTYHNNYQTEHKIFKHDLWCR